MSISRIVDSISNAVVKDVLTQEFVYGTAAS